MQHAAIQSGCARTVAFKLNTVHSDSPSYSFRIYGMLGFFRLQSRLSIYIFGLPIRLSFSSWIKYNQTISHCYILFVKIACSGFCSLHSGLSISSAINGAIIYRIVDFWRHFYSRDLSFLKSSSCLLLSILNTI